MSLKEIRNFVQLTSHIATAGQPTVSQFRLVAEAGYVAVINLALPEHEDSVGNEGEIVTQLGMDYVHIPVPFHAPKPEHIRKFCLILDAYQDAKVFVHCIMNYRVSAFMYHYLTMFSNCSPAQARSVMFDSWQPDGVWSELLNWDRRKIGLPDRQ